MMDTGCSLLDLGLLEEDRVLTLEDYEGAVARWCPGCGDHAVLTAVERLLVKEQLPRERTVFVSGIGCSSRFPHYLKTYGFHGLHGRALPVATGIKLTRPDLNVFVATGDGDCCAIGTSHWIHAVRYNMNMVVLMLDNEIYGLTKNQTSPTTPLGWPSNTQPSGSYLQPMNPISTTLGTTNVSFVAQTADWVPAHLYETVCAAFYHKGFSFVRILQRCPQYTVKIFDAAVRDPGRIELLVHENGIVVPGLDKTYKNVTRHDPSDLDAARRYASLNDGKYRIGLFYRNENVPCYEDIRRQRAVGAEERVRIMNKELDAYAV